jgi:hypothetical protein
MFRAGILFCEAVSKKMCRLMVVARASGAGAACRALGRTVRGAGRWRRRGVRFGPEFLCFGVLRAVGQFRPNNTGFLDAAAWRYYLRFKRGEPRVAFIQSGAGACCRAAQPFKQGVRYAARWLVSRKAPQGVSMPAQP